MLDIDLKKAAKVFAQKYSCGSSVTGPDEIVIQGDVLDDLLDFIPEKWPEVIISPQTFMSSLLTSVNFCAFPVDKTQHLIQNQSVDIRC